MFLESVPLCLTNFVRTSIQNIITFPLLAFQFPTWIRIRIRFRHCTEKCRGKTEVPARRAGAADHIATLEGSSMLIILQPIRHRRATPPPLRRTPHLLSSVRSTPGQARSCASHMHPCDVSSAVDTWLFSDERGRCKRPAQSFYEHIFAHKRFVMLLTIALRLLFHSFPYPLDVYYFPHVLSFNMDCR
jgi:hypothetical protein